MQFLRFDLALLRSRFRGNVFFQESSDAIRFVNNVFQARESVTLVLVDLYLYLPAVGLDPVRHLNGLRGRVAWIIATCDEQKRDLDVTHEIDGRAVLPKRTVLLRVAHEKAVILTQACVFILKLGE